jgi:hypothetical protein
VGGVCHYAQGQVAEGLVLTSADGLNATAIGKVSVESNTGPSLAAERPGATFGLDMPVIDPGPETTGDPGNSWLIYKILLAQARPGSTPPTNFHTIAWAPLSDSERARLSTFIPGREMPYPAVVNAPPDKTEAMLLTWTQMEEISRWIGEPRANGALMTTCR